jgi:transposase
MLDGKVEIITGRERRRRWSDADKLRIVAEAEAAGACFSHVAHRNEVSRGLLWNWRTQVRRGELRPEAPSVFVPVQVVEAPPILAPAASPLPIPTLPASQPLPRMPEQRHAADQIEVELPDGSKLRVGGQVSLAALRRVVAALRG